MPLQVQIEVADHYGRRQRANQPLLLAIVVGLATKHTGTHRPHRP